MSVINLWNLGEQTSHGTGFDLIFAELSSRCAFETKERDIVVSTCPLRRVKHTDHLAISHGRRGSRPLHDHFYFNLVSTCQVSVQDPGYVFENSVVVVQTRTPRYLTFLYSLLAFS